MSIFIRCSSFALILLCFSAHGQDFVEKQNDSGKNQWRTMMGYSFFGGGNITGFTMANEYNRYLNNHLKIGPNIKLSSAKRIKTYKSGLNNMDDDFLAMNALILEVGAMAYYEYMNPSNIGLEFGLGAFYRNLQYTITTGPNTTLISYQLLVEESSVGQYVENTVGFNAFFGFVIRISKVININISGLVQSDTGDNTGYGVFAGISVKF